MITRLVNGLLILSISILLFLIYKIGFENKDLPLWSIISILTLPILLSLISVIVRPIFDISFSKYNIDYIEFDFINYLSLRKLSVYIDIVEYKTDLIIPDLNQIKEEFITSEPFTKVKFKMPVKYVNTSKPFTVMFSCTLDSMMNEVIYKKVLIEIKNER